MDGWREILYFHVWKGECDYRYWYHVPYTPLARHSLGTNTITNIIWSHISQISRQVSHAQLIASLHTYIYTSAS